MDRVADILRAYEDEVLVPLVEGAGLEPVRDQDDLVLFPGSVVVLVNSAARHRAEREVVHWTPLSVLHMDDHERTGDVYRLDARLRLKTETVEFVVADVCGILRLERRPDSAAWIDPLTQQRLLSYPLDQADRVLMHSWYLFQGAILPLIKHGSYRFVETPLERMAFQRTMIHHMAQVYREVV